MDKMAEAIGNAMMELLLALPEGEARMDAIGAVLHNAYFCGHCGYGSEESPNTNCQCWNDE